MTRPLACLLLLGLAGCVAGDATPENPALATAQRLAEGRTCPLPVPERDTLLASALLAQDRTPVDAFLARRPEDPTAQAAASVIDGAPVVDPDQLACLAPYL